MDLKGQTQLSIDVDKTTAYQWHEAMINTQIVATNQINMLRTA